MPEFELNDEPDDLDDLLPCDNCMVRGTMVDGKYKIYRCQPHKILEGNEIDEL